MATISERVLSAGAIIKELLVQGGIPERQIVAVVSDERPAGESLRLVVYRQLAGSIDRTKPQPYQAAALLFEVMVWGQNYETATALAKEVNAALEGHRGEIAAVTVRDIYLTDVSDIYDEAQAYYAKRLEYQIVL
jgi:hypothetical protein